MSQSFKFRFEEMKNNKPGESQPQTESVADPGMFYPSGGGVRNVCFVLAGERRIFLNYAYLVSGEYDPDENIILLSFTTHKVILKGFRLWDLFEQLMQQYNKVISCTDERYNNITDINEVIVNNISIVPIG